MNLMHGTRITCTVLSCSDTTRSGDSTGLLRLISSSFGSSPQAFTHTRNLAGLHTMGSTSGSFHYTAAFISTLRVSEYAIALEKNRENCNILSKS